MEAIVKTDDVNAPPPKPETVQGVLEEARAAVQKYEEKQYPALMAELEAFTKKRKEVDAAYTKAFADLKTAWCDQHVKVAQLDKQLRGLYPDMTCAALVTKHICPKLTYLKDLAGKVAAAERAEQSGSEEALAAAKIADVNAKARLSTLLDNAKWITAALAQVEKWLTEIQGLLGGAQQAFSLYIFWFKLVPLHHAVQPSDWKDDGVRLPGDAPTKLCPESGDAPLPMHVGKGWAWLLDPVNGAYTDELDRAWLEMSNKRIQLAAAEKANKDSLAEPARLRKLHDERIKRLEDDLKGVLESEKPVGSC